MSTLFKSLPLLTLCFVVSNAQAKTISCVGQTVSPYYEDGRRPEVKQTTVFKLTATSKEARVLESVDLTTEKHTPKVRGFTSSGPLTQNHTGKYLKADSKQKKLLGSWIHSTAYLVEPGLGCWGSTVLVILPDKLHQLKKGLEFKTPISEEAIPEKTMLLKCSVLD